ncbi:hypothetical protein AURDEDRAFT_164989 [Auricularia subglabra TFB-10046 SS5]|nr:hypothetical protein AURDEDRAFT_164989 [Auricularia subglabra TFB-10046 SS5]
MPPKLLAASPKTRRQRAAGARQLRSRVSNASNTGSAVSTANLKKKPPVLKKTAPLCRTCSAAGTALYHHWKQCPKKKHNTPAPAKRGKAKKSARTLEVDAHQAALLDELSQSSAQLLQREDDAMSVSSEQTSSDAPMSDGVQDAPGDAGDDVSMAATDEGGEVASTSNEDGSNSGAGAPMSDFFSDSDEASDTEPAGRSARADGDESNDDDPAAVESIGVNELDDESRSASELDAEDDADETSSDDDGASAESSAESDVEPADVESASSAQWSGEEFGVADILADASEGSNAGSDESGAEEPVEGDAASSSSDEELDEDDASDEGEPVEGDPDEDEDEATEADASDGDGEDERAEHEDAEDEAAVEAPNGVYFNQAAHVGRIDSDDDMDSDSRIAKLHQAVEDKGNSQRAIDLHQELENPSPEKVKEQQALLAEAAGGPPPAVPANGDPASTRRAALRAMFAQSLDQREALEAASGGSTVILNGWKGNSAGGESVVYKRNNGQRWARVNKTHKTLKHDFKPMFQSTVQKGEYMADCLGASVMIIAMPHGGLGNAYTWHSDQIEVDAPDLPQAVRDLWFQQLAGARRQHVTEMAAALEALRAEQKATREQLIELNRENDKLKKRLDKTTAKLVREREARL